MARRGEVPASNVPAMLGGFARGLGWTYLTLLLTGGSTFFLAAWSIRRVGTEQFGLFALVGSIVGLVAVFEFAIGTAVVRASALADTGGEGAAEHRDAVHASHGAYAVLGAAGAALSVLASAAIALTGAGSRPYLLPTVLLLGLATSLQLGTSALVAVAQGCRHFSLRSWATMGGVVVRVVVALATVGRFGVAGLAAAQLAGVAVERVIAARMLRRRVAWFVTPASWPEAGALHSVTRFALPLVVINVSGQLFAVSDFVAVGLLVGSSAVGVYNVSSMLPLYAVAVLAVGYDVIFPSLAGSADHADQEAATAFLTRLFSYVAGVAFGLVAWLRRDVVDILLGRPSALGEKVLLVFCGVCLANMFVHGPASLLIARGRQHLMSRAVAVELPVNVVLTVWFVTTFGTVGAAVATLVTVLLMDFVIFPVVSVGEFAEPALRISVREGLAPAAVGAAVSVVAAAAAGVAGAPALRLVLGAALSAGLAVSAGLVLLGPGGRRALREAFAKAGSLQSQLGGVMAQ